ncbi:MAG: LacI family DNA-binding transcriptional regulator [Phycisphaerae bacterium]
MAKRKSIGIRDVARESKASLTTVSLVLNKRDPHISPATRARVLETANRLGYQPSRLAQGLQAQKSGLLAILVPQLQHAFADAYFGELISAIHSHANSADYKILLEVFNPKFIEAKEYLSLFDRHVVDGMFCLGATNTDQFLGDFEDGDRPLLIVNNYLPTRSLNHVRCDYREAGRLAARHLLDHGHRHIGLLHGASEVQTTWDLRAGMEEVLSGAGLPLQKHNTEDGLYTEEGGSVAAVRLLKREPTITGLVAGNDKMAIGAISGLKESGIHVPKDVSVVGCDDMHQAAYCDPPLTTVHTPLYEIGERACKRLLEIVNGRESQVAETYPVTLTIRKSVSSPRQMN